MLLLVALLALFAAGSVALRYAQWRPAAIERIESGAEVVETARGPIEVARFGAGPMILVVHGTPGGYDQAAGLGEPARRAGFALAAVSRPGYLRTPLEVGRTPAEQADAYAALLDAIGIERVAVVGISGGGPSALEFAIRHPERCWAVVDLMGISRARLPGESHPMDDMEDSIVARLLGNDFGAWLLSGLLHRNPQRMLQAVIPGPLVRERILGRPERLAALLALVDSALLLPERRGAGVANDRAQFEALEIAGLERINAPTLVLHGSADVNVPLAMAELVARRVPDAQLLTFPEADHFMVVSHDEEVFGAMFDFLSAARGV